MSYLQIGLQSYRLWRRTRVRQNYINVSPEAIHKVAFSENQIFLQLQFLLLKRVPVVSISNIHCMKIENPAEQICDSSDGAEATLID